MSTSTRTPIKEQADRAGELDMIGGLVSSTGVLRVLSIRGDMDIGKSLLLKCGLKFIRDNGCEKVALYDCNGDQTELVDMFESIKEQLNFPFALTEKVKQSSAFLTWNPNVSINKNDVGRDLNVSISFDLMASIQRDFEQKLSVAFRDDLKMLASREAVIILVDHFERATSSMKRWFLNYLLPIVATTEQIRVIFAGRELIPEGGNWEVYVQRHVLTFVEYTREWIEYFAGSLEVELPHDIMDTLMALCDRNPRVLHSLVRQYCAAKQIPMMSGS